jgi:hypothetical protein
MALLVEILKVLSPAMWPLVILAIALIYRRDFGNFLRRLIEVDATKDRFTVKALEEQRKTLDQIQERIDSLFHQGKNYEDYRDALHGVEQLIISYIEDSLRQGINHPTIDLKIMAVAMTFSWQFFIVPTLPRLLQRYPGLHINLGILFVDHHHLELLNLKNADVDWVAISKQRVNDIWNFCQGAEDFQGRLSVTAKTYRNLPHWHGLMINNEHLFLGRTNWAFPRNEPKLTVGQNIYRYFNRTSPEGGQRIDLFSNWYRFYSEHASDQICSTSPIPFRLPEQSQHRQPNSHSVRSENF